MSHPADRSILRCPRRKRSERARSLSPKRVFTWPNASMRNGRNVVLTALTRKSAERPGRNDVLPLFRPRNDDDHRLGQSPWRSVSRLSCDRSGEGLEPTGCRFLGTLEDTQSWYSRHQYKTGSCFTKPSLDPWRLTRGIWVRHLEEAQACLR